MKCSVCGDHKAKLYPVYSSLIPTVLLHKCSYCKDADNEPRYLIILAGRSNAVESKRLLPYIRDRKYFGEEISAKEILA